MNMLTHRDGRPLMEPMYYENPESDEAYNVPNEYWFGTELIVAPITAKTDKKTLTSSTDVWLPAGRYTDIFTGRIYNGGRTIKMFRDLSSIPVLAKEGSIIPLATEDRTNDCSNPEDMEILIFRGNGKFRLYEDDGETMNYQNGAFAETEFEVTEKNGDVTFNVSPAEGDLSVIPAKRRYTFSFRDIADCENVQVTVNNEKAVFEQTAKDGLIQISAEIAAADKLQIVLKNISAKKNPPRKEMLTDMLSKVQGSNNAKMVLYTACLEDSFNGKILANKAVRDSVKEIKILAENS